MELRRILSVDDSEADQFLNRYRIQDRMPQVQVRAAYDGIEALELLREADYRPDLILLDINMPRMNGLEFLEAYSREMAHANSPVVMLSSSLVASDWETAKQFEQVRGIFRKPLDTTWPERLQEMLQGEED